MDVIGGTKIEEGQREIPTEQCDTNVGRGGATMDGMGRFQRRRSVRGQHRLVDGGAQHQHMRRHQPPRVDVA